MKKKLLVTICSFTILGVSIPVYAGGVTGVEVKKDDSENMAQSVISIMISKEAL